MKYIIIVPDGMADYPVPELGNRTPLQAARTTNMDYLAQNGLTGLVKTIPDGCKPGSDIGNLALMGYDPHTCYSGRAPLEAANLGIELADDEIAFRCNLVTIENNIMKDYSAGHISTAEAAQLIKALDEKMDEEGVRFVAGKSYRHLLILKTRRVQEFNAIPTTPPHDILNQDIHKYLPTGKEAPALLKLMEKSTRILDGHDINQTRIDLKENPANMIWLWGQGTRPRIPSFREKFGLTGAIISAVDLVNGIGRLAGLDIITVPGITGYYDTNYAGKAEYALDALKTRDFVYIHIEAPDEAGHNGDFQNKTKCIELIDKEILGRVLNHFDPHDAFRVLVLPDHPTPVSLRTHSRDPVPFAMFGTDIEPDPADGLSEAFAKQKGLKFDSGEAMVDRFIRRT